MSNDLAPEVASIICEAGGKVIGRTKLQKMVYFLVASGLADDIPFVYKHYGPYSEQLADAARSAGFRGLLRENEEIASWGGFYSVYTVDNALLESTKNREEILRLMAKVDSVELELAATALFLKKQEHVNNPWAETERRKPDKAKNGRLNRAKALYEEISKMNTPVKLPSLSE